jgi:Cd2+/Zn2+-exporting ATPase
MAAIERHSEHHLASAIIAEAAAQGVKFSDIGVDHFEALPGRGVKAVVGGTQYLLGNPALGADHGLLTPDVEAMVGRFAAEGKTVLVFGRPEKPLGVVAARDTTRHGGADAVEALRRIGVRHTLLISGDRGEVTGKVAREAGVAGHRSGLLPEQKVAAVDELKREWGTVAMVGDGVNDAPALASSSVGIAMGVAGTDAALETADIVLMSDDLRKLPHLFSLSKAAMRIVRQNIGLALALKLLFLLLSITGGATLWMAVLADDGAAFAVILNGLRLLSFRGKIR